MDLHRPPRCLSAREQNSALRKLLDVRERSTFTAEAPARTTDLLRCVEDRRTMNPRLLDLRSDFPPSIFAEMAAEANELLRSDGLRHNGKWNAPVGPAVEAFVEEPGFLDVVRQFSNVHVERVLGATFIAYTEPGEHLPFHLDEPRFGDANVLLCLRHDVAGEDVSSTVFVLRDGFREFVLESGVAVFFDGATTPHGRTPISVGEQVVLVSFGLAVERARAPHCRGACLSADGV